MPKKVKEKNEEKKEKKAFSITQSNQIEKLIKQCINEQDIDTGGANICGLMVSPTISGSVAGRCIRASHELKHFSDYDYIIQISEQYWDNLTQESRKLLVLHECMHILVDYNKGGQPKFKLRKHDVEDFAKLIEKYGVRWLRQVNLVREHLQDKGSE